MEPNLKWGALRSAELSIKTELWKFRCRLGQYSQNNQSLPKVIKNMTDFTNKLSAETLNEAKLTESSLLNSYTPDISKHFQ